METQHLTPNLYITRDEEQIIDLLVDHNEMPKDFEMNHLLSFYNERDFHIALYFQDKSDRGFQMYVVKDFSLHVADLATLRGIFANLIRQGYDVHMLQKAHAQIDNMIHMAKTFRAMMNPDLLDASEQE